jgi:hypothetical protein
MLLQGATSASQATKLMLKQPPEDIDLSDPWMSDLESPPQCAKTVLTDKDTSSTWMSDFDTICTPRPSTLITSDPFSMPLNDFDMLVASHETVSPGKDASSWLSDVSSLSPPSKTSPSGKDDLKAWLEGEVVEVPDGCVGTDRFVISEMKPDPYVSGLFVKDQRDSTCFDSDVFTKDQLTNKPGLHSWPLLYSSVEL